MATDRHRTATPSGKTRFDDIYDQPDPRAYFRTLAPYEYEIPHHAQAVFRRTRELRSRMPGDEGPVTVLDVCCSYGINAALLNHDLTLADLYAHYTSAALTPQELIECDKEFYATRRRPDATPMIGLDAAANATRYALDAGLLRGVCGGSRTASAQLRAAPRGRPRRSDHRHRGYRIHLPPYVRRAARLCPERRCG
ncbi:hypothetical protein [Streptomyces sp. 135]|uniref:hypothetical protein n=1 Tax=Streptomyces sp. 135 TaxID=2838850 RepID=UPI001CC18038|nr:hypothetical protein [Streptomyces sp. 135]